jgi:phosphate transport system substrate-binding protein
VKNALIVLAIAALASPVFAQDLNGAGATFPAPIYQKWFAEYSAQHPGVRINYQPIGSGGGIRQVQAGTVDFGATDGPMSDEQMKSATVRVFHVPTVLGAVVPIYNLPGVTAELKFSPDVLADIYLGKISKWNDSRIAKDNPGVKLPDQQIITVHRADGSGTTYIFTDYLSKVSDAWKSGPGKGTSISWPGGSGSALGGKGNEGVSGTVRQTPGAIGYVELIYAAQNKIAFGMIKNSAGEWVKASVEGVTAAAANSVKVMPDDFRVSITNAPGKDSYPIASFTWLLIPLQSRDAAKGKVIKDFLYWMLAHGEQEAPALYYAPLPKSVAEKVHGAIQYFK